MPVRLTVSVADWPLQIVFVPLITAVGLAFTVTIGVPLRSVAIDAHLLSLTAVRVYVLVDAGETANVNGFALILLIVTGATPSV